MFAYYSNNIAKIEEAEQRPQQEKEEMLFQIIETKLVSDLYDWMEIINEEIKRNEIKQSKITQLTDDFQKWEFDSKTQKVMSKTIYENVLKLAINLQVLRNEIGEAINVTSGYRTRAENERIGGAKESKHLTGQAADINCASYTPEELKIIIEKLIKEGKMEKGGLASYSKHTHYDNRGHNARWINK